MGLLFRAQKNFLLEKVQLAEARLHQLGTLNELALGQIRKIQVAAVQVVELYRVKLW